jgi:hypothetical protein
MQVQLTKGRKRLLKQFTIANGLWILTLISGSCAIIVSLFLLGYLQVH